MGSLTPSQYNHPLAIGEKQTTYWQTKTGNVDAVEADSNM